MKRKLLYNLVGIALAFLFSVIATADVLKTATAIPEDLASVRAVIPIYSQKLSFQLPTSWKPAFQNQTQDSFMMEFTPKNESIQSWSNLFSVQGFKKQASKIGAEQFLDNLANEFRSVCGDALIYKKLGASTVDGFESYAAILGCAEMPSSHPTGVQKGQSEFGYFLSIAGKKDIYLIHKSVRTEALEVSEVPLSEETVEEFLREFLPFELCKKGGHQVECKK